MSDAPPRPAPAEDPLVGVRVGEYHIRRVLGRGGMGVVYEAEDTALGIPVALKSISAAFARDATFVRRFRTEARAMARVASPHIVRVMALRETEHGLFIVMEYVDGGDLHARMSEGPMPWKDVWPLLRQMLLGLEAAHTVGVVHRDIKPRNVLLTKDGTVKLTDFGLARLQADGEATVTQAVAGTLAYMSPEQIRALPSLDGRSDLFSLGLTAYEALAGRLPFDRSTGEFTVMRAIVDEPFPLPTEFKADVAPAVARALMRALEKNPDDRYATAADMREGLAAAGDDEAPTRTQIPPLRRPAEPAVAPDAPVAAPAAGPARRVPSRRLGALAGGLLAVALAVGAAVWWTRPGRLVAVAAPGVSYFVDDEPAAADAEIELEPGPHAVRCLAAGLAATAEIDVRRGRTRRVECFRPEQAVDVAAYWNGDRTDAAVLVDGRPAGAAPVRLTLETGRHTLHVRSARDGRLDTTLTVDVRPTFDPEAPAPIAVAVRGGVDPIASEPPVALSSPSAPSPTYSAPSQSYAAPPAGPSSPGPQAPRPSPPQGSSMGTLVAETAPGVTLSIDGSGIPQGSRDMRPGTYTASCEAGPLSETTRVTITPNQRTPVRCYASERVVSVAATSDDPSRPWVSVVVDGQPQGQTPTRITLGPGRHSVFVRRRGFQVVGEDMRTVDVPPRFAPGPHPPVALTFEVRAETP